jgi:hypothetical protein
VTDENRTRFFFAANGARADEAANEDERGVRRGGYRSGRIFRLFRETIHITKSKTKKQFLRYILRAAFFFYGRKILSREEPPAT